MFRIFAVVKTTIEVMRKSLSMALLVGALLFPAVSWGKMPKKKVENPSVEACLRGLATINQTSAEAIVGFLASDALEGREAGYNTSFIAAEYMVSQLREAGLEPLDGAYKHPFFAVQPAGTRRPQNRWEVQADSVAKVQKGPYRQMNMVNVFGVIPGELENEYVIVGAHRDHWGKDDWKVGDQIYNGADDNASGVSCALQIARAMMASGMKPKRTVIFAFWDGEEKGLLGSTHFVETWKHMPEVKAYLNFDMAGGCNPDNPDYVKVIYTKYNDAFARWIRSDKEELAFGFNLDLRDVDYDCGGSDQQNFGRFEIPYIWYHTDWTPYYHQVTDQVETVNWTKLVEVAKASYLNAWRLANEEAY